MQVYLSVDNFPHYIVTDIIIFLLNSFESYDHMKQKIIMNYINKFKFITYLLSLSLLLNCGTVYVPQVLPEGRGIARSEGQQKIEITVIPLTEKEIRKANEDNYVRRIIDSGDLSRAAKLISVNQAINEKIPPKKTP